MNATVDASLRKAYHLIKVGETRQARAILLPILRADQDIADAWYLLGYAVRERYKRQVCFQEVLRLDPSNQAAQRQLARLTGRAPARKPKRRAGFGLALGVWGTAGTLGLLFFFIVVGDWWLSNNRLNTAAAIAPIVTVTPTALPTLSPTTETLPEATTPTLGVTPSVSATVTLTMAAPSTTPRPLTASPTETVGASPTVTVPIPTLTRPPDAKQWRSWPTVPVLSAKARSILQKAATNSSLSLQTFSRVGDCQLTTGTFLGGYVTGQYTVPEAYKPTVDYFHDSFITESITATNGLGINSVLNPMFAAGAGHNECNADETPLDCELRLRRPAIVMVAMGTNWVPRAELSFEKHLRQVVDRILESGALPILATKADNIEEDWKLNEAVARVAYEYDLPLVNVWRSVQDLPHHGLESPANIYLTGDGWMRRNEAWLHTLDEVRKLIQVP